MDTPAASWPAGAVGVTGTEIVLLAVLGALAVAVALLVVWPTPIRRLAVRSGRGDHRPPLTDAGLLAVARLRAREGPVEPEEDKLIASMLRFRDSIVREVMVPRPDMVTVDATFRAADAAEVMLLSGYSRLPVCGQGIDDVLGLAYAKDLLRAERDGKEDEPVTDLLRPAWFVPETMRAPELLRDMQHDQVHMAIVVDEYGGTAGLITLEDLIEQLVGEIADEFDVQQRLVERLPNGRLLVDARTSLDEVNELLGAELPDGDWDTIGGLIYSELGRVPREGESVDIDGWRLVARDIQGRRIGQVQIGPRAPGEDGPNPSRP